MLGRKQSVRNNEDWKNALDHIEETVSKKELDSLVKKTVKDIKEKCKGKKAAYAWSAGKDSLVLGEICEKAGIDQSVLVRCNLEYPAFIAWIEQNKPSGLEIVNTGQAILRLNLSQKFNIVLRHIEQKAGRGSVTSPFCICRNKMMEGRGVHWQGQEVPTALKLRKCIRTG